MKISVLTPYLPHRDVGHGSGIAARDLVIWLAKRHQVQVVTLVRPGESERLADVTGYGASVFPIPFADKTATGADRWRMLTQRAGALTRSLGSGYPLFVEKYWSPALARAVDRAVTDFQPDAVHVECLQMALHVRDLRRRRDRSGAAGPRLILNSIELGSLPRERRAQRTGNPLVRIVANAEAAAWRRLQVAASGWADRTLCVTPEDHELYAAMGGRGLVTVPVGMDLEQLRADWAPAPGARFLFVGSFRHRPNRLAVDFLLDRAWPRIREAVPDAELTIAGRGFDAYVASRSGGTTATSDGVSAPGFVEDLTDLFRDHHVFLAPLPEGGGIKLKVLEAMARGIPVVTTEIGAEGITGPEDDAVVITDCDDRFAAAALAALRDHEGSAGRAIRARRLMESRFGWSSIIGNLEKLYEGSSKT